MREHEGQPVLEAGASVYRLGPRCRTQARCTTYEWLLILLELVIGGCEVEGRGCAAYRGGGEGGRVLRGTATGKHYLETKVVS